MRKSVVLRDIIPFVIWFSAMIFIAILIDVILHYFDIVFIGRYLGFLGTLTILISFLYSLKKRKIIQFSSPKVLLDLHEYLAISGSVMILVHAGIHIHSILPWLAILMLLINVSSGLVGKYLLSQANKTLKERKLNFENSGKTEDEISKAIFWDATAVDRMKKWRKTHLPITYFLGLLSLIHIVSVLLFN
ncbi:hypothetical protein [Flavobacterium taihuense]|uniref:DUF4149 domain-containing protein n=1 Tax=Flavobacterium taihuense TaxID=2857508 RepID=A0ABS6XVQ2_9FLAO|nr:hypothetical protein [Flavobacterium taihuense]MBW4360442.1 hypothetical protein [Flavobacterium taihuense]